MTRFEKITKELTLEKAAEHISTGLDDSYCYEMCEKHKGNRYKCPFRDELDLEGPGRCRKCAEEWLKEEVEEGEG